MTGLCQKLKRKLSFFWGGKVPAAASNDCGNSAETGPDSIFP
jgi:hypothetical protein